MIERIANGCVGSAKRKIKRLEMEHPCKAFRTDIAIALFVRWKHVL